VTISLHFSPQFILLYFLISGLILRELCGLSLICAFVNFTDNRAQLQLNWCFRQHKCY